MKFSIRKLLLNFIFTLFLLFISPKSFTQAYAPFPDSNAVWSETYILGGQFYTKHYKLFGDTIINSKTYKKLYYNNGLIDTVIDIASQNTTYCNALRQDTSTKKVYFFPNNYTNEYVLYDFNLNVGDTFHIPLAANFDIIVRCTYTYYSMIGGYFGKSFNIDYDFLGNVHSSAWLEGVGDMVGLFNYNNLNSYNVLLCLTYNDSIIYHYDSPMIHPFLPPFADTSIFHKCSYRGIYWPTGINDHTNNTQNITVYPNPIISKSTISIPNAFSLNGLMVEVLDIQGRKIKNFHNLNSHQLTLCRADFKAAGLYFVRIKSDNYLETIKLIVQ